jgi:hypothetical protein
MLLTLFAFHIVLTPKRMHHTESTALALSLQTFPRTAVKRDIVTPSTSSLIGIVRNRVWHSIGRSFYATALISNPVNLRPVRLTCVLVPYAGSPTRQPTAVFLAPI